jgi:hypothetical protein
MTRALRPKGAHEPQGIPPVTFLPARLVPNLFRALALAALAALAASCGSGAVGPSPNVSDPAKITILPGTAVMYSGLPTTFSITGGSGAYVVTSDNQAVIPSPGSVLTNSLTLVANNVTAEVNVTLTVRDTGTLAPVTAVVTVRPGTVNNNIDIAYTRAACSPALCSGDDALVTVTLSQGGIPLPARGVRYDVVSGDYRLITTPAGTQPEVLATTATTVTDETGKARMRLRATPLVPNQTAILQITDIATGAFQRTSFVIAQDGGTNGSFFTIPASVTYTGPRAGVCASGAASNFFVYGGTPPYTIANPQPNALAVSPGTVGASGGSFSVTVLGTFCPSATTLAVTDSAGRTINVTVTSNAGTVTPDAVKVAPATASVLTCTDVASATVTGGLGTYLQPTSSSSALVVTQSGNLLTIRRAVPSPAPSSATASVAVSDGLTTASVTVTLSPPLVACP